MGFKMLRCVSSVEEALNAVEGSNGYDLVLLDKIPMEFRTKQVCEKAINVRFINFVHLPYELKLDKDIFSVALKHYPLFLGRINQNDITKEMVDLTMAWWKDFGVIKYVPEQFRTYEMCLEAVLNDEDLSIYITDPDIFEKVVNEVNKNKDKLTDL